MLSVTLALSSRVKFPLRIKFPLKINLIKARGTNVFLLYCFSFCFQKKKIAHIRRHCNSPFVDSEVCALNLVAALISRGGKNKLHQNKLTADIC